MIPTCGIFADKLKTMTTFKDFSNSGMLEKEPTNNAAPPFGIAYGINGPLKLQNQGFKSSKLKRGEKV